jgi:outer membrane protein assembly factor BamA
MEYVLPIGSATVNPVMTYRLRQGMLVSEPSGGDSWNPLESGVSVLMLQQRFTYQSYETDLGKIDGDVSPVDLALLYNNTDYAPNPSKGSSQYICLTHDFSERDDNGEWSFVEFEASKYFALPTIESALQQVIALNFWTGFSPEWDQYTNGDGESFIKHKPPFFEGADLGGFYRMRGYPNHRFNDKAVIYSTAEYRHTLRWNPLRNISWLGFLDPDWIQLVASVEGGRVSDTYTASELLSDWKFCGGVGIRLMLSGAVFRLDTSVSDEAVNTWVMMGHPF